MAVTHELFTDNASAGKAGRSNADCKVSRARQSLDLTRKHQIKSVVIADGCYARTVHGQRQRGQSRSVKCRLQGLPGAPKPRSDAKTPNQIRSHCRWLLRTNCSRTTPARAKPVGQMQIARSPGRAKASI